LILILSDEFGVRGNDGYLRIVLLIKLKVQLLNSQDNIIILLSKYYD
jgi:hypothetical protein